MKITNSLKKRFCKDAKVNIEVLQEPYFSKRLELYDNQFNSMKKYKDFLDVLKDFTNEQDYFEYYNSVKDKIINHLKNTEGIKKLIKADFKEFQIPNTGITQKHIFKESNIGKTLLSIDMIKANFSSLKHYDKSIFKVNGKLCNTYEKFVGEFTEYGHIINSKYIRQVVFGTVNPKRQVMYEKYLMYKILIIIKEMLKADQIDLLDIALNFSNDEIVIDVTNLDDKMLENLKDNIMNNELNVPLKLEQYVLGKIQNTDGYAKVFEDGEADIKCLSKLMYPFVLRFLNGEEIQEEDKVFFHEGRLAAFLETPEISIVTEMPR